MQRYRSMTAAHACWHCSGRSRWQAGSSDHAGAPQQLGRLQQGGKLGGLQLLAIAVHRQPHGVHVAPPAASAAQPPRACAAKAAATKAAAAWEHLQQLPDAGGEATQARHLQRGAGSMRLA